MGRGGLYEILELVGKCAKAMILVLPAPDEVYRENAVNLLTLQVRQKMLKS